MGEHRFKIKANCLNNRLPSFPNCIVLRLLFCQQLIVLFEKMASMISVHTTASRFALLQIDSDSDSDASDGGKTSTKTGRDGKPRQGKAGAAGSKAAQCNDKRKDKKKKKREQQQSEANEVSLSCGPASSSHECCFTWPETKPMRPDATVHEIIHSTRKPCLRHSPTTPDSWCGGAISLICPILITNKLLYMEMKSCSSISQLVNSQKIHLQ